jgi:hypothetical protein
MKIVGGSAMGTRRTLRTALSLLAFAFAIPVHSRQHVHDGAEPAPAMSCPAHASKNAHEREASETQSDRLLEPGQAIFGALSEALERLEADPATDWTRVDLDALREHLVQMDLLFGEARVSREPLPDGMRFVVRGRDEVLEAASAIGPMHAQMLRASVPSWQIRVERSAEGVVFEVRSSELAQQVKIRALGFAGLLTLGAHHADHHWHMATGGVAHHP